MLFVKKKIKLIAKNWWLVLILIFVIYFIVVSLVNNSELNRITNAFLGYCDKMFTPLGVILGLILGYPILKKKLVDSYITKQFKIIHDNNRIVRKECLRLKEKYPVKYISKPLNHKFIEEIINDVKKLSELAIDANPDSYKYSYLLYKSLYTFGDQTTNGTPNNFDENYYCETISTFVFNHVEQIYLYSKSIGFLPKNNVIREKSILSSKLNKYVTENKYYQVDGIDYSLKYKKASALLVTFFSININCLMANNGLLFQSCYKPVPSPSPFARIMYSQNLYMPLILEGEKFMNVLIPKCKVSPHC